MLGTINKSPSPPRRPIPIHLFKSMFFLEESVVPLAGEVEKNCTFDCSAEVSVFVPELSILDRVFLLLSTRLSSKKE
jgi:hypothetical protein